MKTENSKCNIQYIAKKCRDRIQYVLFLAIYNVYIYIHIHTYTMYDLCIYTCIYYIYIRYRQKNKQTLLGKQPITGCGLGQLAIFPNRNFWPMLGAFPLLIINDQAMQPSTLELGNMGNQTSLGGIYILMQPFIQLVPQDKS